MPNIYPVIMCGGSGTRLWPASRPSRPKQFLSLIGGTSLFQETVKRVTSLESFRELIVVTGDNQSDFVTAQLAELETGATILLEPEGRDSAPAVAVAAHYVSAFDPDGILAIVASDHHIPTPERFRDCIADATRSAKEGRIVTLGIRPLHPSPAYGYISPENHNAPVSPIAAFVEKPDEKTAEEYINKGFLWNSGNFIARASVLLDEFATHAPDIARDALASLNTAEKSGNEIRLSAAFRDVRKISIDYAIMEHTERASVVASDLDWSDMGAWDAVHGAMPRDHRENAASGDVVLNNTAGCHVRAAEGNFVVLSGVEGLNVVVEDDVVFVSRLDQSQNVKQLVDALKTDGRSETDFEPPSFNLTETAQTLSRWLRTSSLPLWWTYGFDRETMMWRESLERDGDPSSENLRARVQGRQTYCYAEAARLGFPGPWDEAVSSGMTAMDRFRGPNGLLQTLYSADGKLLDEEVLLYDQTFNLLALAVANNQVENAEARALSLLDLIELEFHHEGPGFRERGLHPYQSNAHMHLLEAALEWIEAGNSNRWHELAGQITALAKGHFIDQEKGFLREFFDENWQPASGADGRIVEPGHQFEWAWLLARWTRISGDTSYHGVAQKLFECGIAGTDPTRGVALDTMNDELKPVTERARLWQQTEWLKAALILRDMTEDDRKPIYLEQVKKAAAAIQLYLATDVQGIWYDKMNTDGGFELETAPASSFYHIVAAIAQLRKSAGLNNGRLQ